MLRTPSFASCLLFLLALAIGCQDTPPAAQDARATPVAPEVTQAAQPGKKPAKDTSNEGAKLQDIRKLLVVTGSAEIGIQSLKNMVGQFRTSMPNVPAAFWDEFMKEVSAEELVELIVPIYDKHYTHAEIKELITFYQTPIGKKSIRVMPQIVQESQLAGQKWGLALGQKVQEKLKNSGHAK